MKENIMRLASTKMFWELQRLMAVLSPPDVHFYATNKPIPIRCQFQPFIKRNRGIENRELMLCLLYLFNIYNTHKVRFPSSSIIKSTQ